MSKRLQFRGEKSPSISMNIRSFKCIDSGFSRSQVLLFMIFSAIIVIGIVSYPRVVVSLLVSLVGVAALLILADVIKERLKSKREGYRVYMRGGAEDGTVTYDEEGRILELYFDRGKNTIYVPADGKWKEIMPTWAKDRKDEIMGRTKKHVGRRWIGEDWRYEETGEEKLLMSLR